LLVEQQVARGRYNFLIYTSVVAAMVDCDRSMEQYVRPVLKNPDWMQSKYQQSEQLKLSLEMLLHEAKRCADEWNDVKRKYNDRRSFSTFLRHVQMFGLDWHKYIVSEDNDINVSNQPNRWSSLQASSHDVVHLRPELTSNSDWVMANMYYGRSLSLMRLLQRIQKESPDEFSRKQ
ncbi:hypothetical protein MKW94_025373, partial [Papaver nudicaule]|nr:hypothetical protein [Papaver nudicaule]